MEETRIKQIKVLLSTILALHIIIGCFLPVQASEEKDINTELNGFSSEIDSYPVLIAEADKTSETGITTGPAIELKKKKPKVEDETQWYRKQNPMKKEHQKLLWDYCNKRGLDYVDMLALIYTESNFDEKSCTGKYYGYFQISKGNCANLAKTLKTKNTPLDGTININWGTAMYSWILADKRVKGLEGKEKRDAALSIYQRGTGGYDKYGINKSFLKVYYKKRAIVSGWFD